MSTKDTPVSSKPGLPNLNHGAFLVRGGNINGLAQLSFVRTPMFFYSSSSTIYHTNLYSSMEQPSNYIAAFPVVESTRSEIEIEIELPSLAILTSRRNYEILQSTSGKKEKHQSSNREFGESYSAPLRYLAWQVPVGLPFLTGFSHGR